MRDIWKRSPSRCATPELSLARRLFGTIRSNVCKSLAEKLDGRVHAFHCYDPRIAVATATANAYIPVSLPFDEIEQQMHEDHQKRFNEITSFHAIDDDRSHFVAGLTHEELLAIATELDAAVVVMGAVSRNRWKRLFIAATAERTLEQLPCDLLIVKPDWYGTPPQSAAARDVNRRRLPGGHPARNRFLGSRSSRYTG